MSPRDRQILLKFDISSLKTISLIVGRTQGRARARARGRRGRQQNRLGSSPRWMF